MSHGNNWLKDPQNIIAIAGILVSAGFLVYDWLWRSRKVIFYRVQLDTPFGVTPEQADGFPDLRVRLERAGDEIDEGSLVLLRVANGGSQHIVRGDFGQKLCFIFEGRTIMGVEIPEAYPEAIKDMLKENGGLQYNGSRLTLPPIPINRKNHFKLLVLLSGAGTGVKQQDGFLSGGQIRKGPGTWQGPSTGVIAAGIVVALLFGLFVGIHVDQPSAAATGQAHCASGPLSVYGSTAFEPIATQVANTYSTSCNIQNIPVQAMPTGQAISRLEEAGSSKPGGADGQIAMSDGLAAQGNHQPLVAHPIAAVVFSIVVNTATGIHNLTINQLHGIYNGKFTNWKQLGGNDVQISIVSRTAESGTRHIFEETVLQATEQAITSNDCVNPLNTGTQPIRCERRSTAELLNQVNDTPGAIGYAELSDTATHPNVQRIQVNGHDADIETAKLGLYPFWTVETFYTYGNPRTGNQVDTFLRYITSAHAKNSMRMYGYVPCVDPQSGTLCTRP